uniref:Uncharacterized protein n=1 Tax=viral metagenome TaxID=1070528 RepID=A0A6C0BV39_9ZZZZ
MSTVSEEIQELQLRIVELEKQKKEKEENDKKTSIDHNFKVLNDLLTEKKTKVNNKYYGKVNNKYYGKDESLSVRYYTQQLVTHLEALYNILQIVDERLKKLEEK